MKGLKSFGVLLVNSARWHCTTLINNWIFRGVCAIRPECRQNVSSKRILFGGNLTTNVFIR